MLNPETIKFNCSSPAIDPCRTLRSKQKTRTAKPAESWNHAMADPKNLGTMKPYKNLGTMKANAEGEEEGKEQENEDDEN